MKRPAIRVPIALAAGDRVMHGKFGAGTVIAPPDDGKVQVQFDQGGTRVLVADGDYLQPLEEANPADPFLPGKEAWRHSVFSFEPKEVEHDNVTMWEPLVPDRAELMKRVPALLGETSADMGYAAFNPPPCAVPTSWRKGLVMSPGNSADGALFTLIVDDDGNRVTNVTPHFGRPSQCNVLLESVRVWPNGVNATVTCSIDDMSVTFFDNHFLDNRGWYFPDAQLTFLLSAIAISCRIGIARIPTNYSPEQQAHWRETYQDVGVAVPRIAEPPAEFSLEGMAMYLDDESPNDDYANFRGRLGEVKEVAFMDVPCWQVAITFLRTPDDHDTPIRMVISSLVWTHDAPPAPGMDVEGVLWLQGEMWASHWT